VFSSRIVLRRARAIAEQRDNFAHRQRMISRLELMFCRTLFSKSPLVSTSFANLTIDESLEAVPIATD
jgi:hypothetical protein